MRVIIAARLSQKADRQTGIESQDELTREWAERNGHTVVATVADRKSGTVQPWDRPKLRPWVTDPVKMAQFDAVVGYRFDRLSRGDNQSTNQIEQWAFDNGKQLLTEDGLVFPCEGADGIRWDMAKRLAHEEWLTISGRYRRMQSFLRANDYFVGRPPYGYAVVPKDKHKTLAPDPIKGPVVREMVDRYLDGDSLRDIARWLESSGAPRPSVVDKPWSPKAVNDILRNEALIGRRKHEGKIVLRFEALLDLSVWRELQESLDANRRRRGKVRNNPAMLTDVLYCGKCGRIMHARYNPKTHKDGTTYTWRGYRCDGTPQSPSRCKFMPSMADVDEQVSEGILDSYGDATYWEKKITQGHSYEAELDENADEIAALDPDAPDYLEEHAALIAERKRLQSLPTVPDKVEDIANGTVAERWAEADTAGRRQILLDMGWRIYLSPRPEPGEPFGMFIESQGLASIFRAREVAA
jgi:site-specific DNA recombinase